ncbi:MAG TPA: hypothetical protein VMW54_13895 [Terriglobia bacterium]|nr:hypothetical protein [Terriglobia bacterium]
MIAPVTRPGIEDDDRSAAAGGENALRELNTSDFARAAVTKDHGRGGLRPSLRSGTDAVGLPGIA